MVNGFHTIVDPDDTEAIRAFLRDVLGWPHVDAGGGWLIFETKPAELGVHPTGGDHGEVWGDVPTHWSSMTCDDIEASRDELGANGVRVAEEVVDEGCGLISTTELLGAGPMMLCQPRHDVAHDLDG